MIDEPQGAFMYRSSIVLGLSDSGPFHGLLLSVMGPKRFPCLLNPGVRLRVSHQQSQYWLILAHFVDHYSMFRGPKAISTIDDPRGAFPCPSSILTLLANSDTFRGLLLTVWDLEATSIVVETQCALPCRSSTLIVLTDSGPFRGLLLTVLGSRSDFHN